MKKSIEQAKQAALDVLRHNATGPFGDGMPSTAGWAYPEPYTRDWMISAWGIMAVQDEKLMEVVRHVLETAAQTQTRLGLITSLINDPEDRGSSDTTPLFLITTAFYRKLTGEKDFLETAVQKALTWMEYCSPTDRVIVGQLPTSDWRDELWVTGFGLFVNSLVYAYLKLFGRHGQANILKDLMGRFTVKEKRQQRHVHEGLTLDNKPYYAFWSYKVHNSERFDLVGNSMAILSGLIPKERASEIISWVEAECAAMRDAGDLVLELPPNFFPFINRSDPDWRARYEEYNRPGEYHNGGIWPFVCGIYIAAIVAAGEQKLAEQNLEKLAELVKPAKEHEVDYGFNEWFKAQDGKPMGADWQTWSAAMYLYAYACVKNRQALFFSDIL
jgi:hypothetical protein